MPIVFQSGGYEITRLMFQVRYQLSDGPRKTSFNPFDTDGDGIPDSVRFPALDDIQDSTTIFVGNPERGVLVFDFRSPTPLPDGVLATVDLRVIGYLNPEELIYPIEFISVSAFSGSDMQDMENVQNGSVKVFAVPPTAIPTPTREPGETGRSSGGSSSSGGQTSVVICFPLYGVWWCF